MLRFDQGLELKTPISNFIATRFRYEIPMLFPYWSVIERKKSFCFGQGECLFNQVNRSSVLYQMYTAPSQNGSSTAYVLGIANKQVREYQMKESGAFSTFEAKRVLVVTWLRLRPLEETPSEGIVSIASVGFCRGSRVRYRGSRVNFKKVNIKYNVNIIVNIK